jgi:tripartite ATP-independent transporter DctM subunit
VDPYLQALFSASCSEFTAMKATYLAVILFFIFVSVDVPISISLMLGIAVSLVVFDVYSLITVATLFYSSLDNYLLVAIPLFMLAGIAMSHGGIARRIFDFSEAILGFMPGSLGAVNIMSSALFSGMSGSSVADVAGLGPIEIKEMVDRKYPLSYATAMTLASSTLAVIVPPSILMIIYATIANVSVGKALAAGFLPGLFIALLLIVVNTYFAIKRKWPRSTFSFRRIATTGLKGMPALLAPVIVLGGIFFGIFTPTEASAIALVYCLLIGTLLYRELGPRQLNKIVYEGGRTSGIVALELASGLLFSNLMTLEGIPEVMTAWITNFSGNPVLIMFLVNVVLLAAGMFLNPGFSIIVFSPLLLPIVQSIGYTPIHFGVIMVANLALGLITPPVGACLYVGSVISGLPVEKIIREMLPFYFVLLLGLIGIILVPQMSEGFVNLVFNQR